jgi:putative exosortase-associated protein (TIGR04073 family)
MQHSVRSCRLTALTAILVLASPAAAYAQDPLHKVGRDTVNVLTAWVELPKQIGTAIEAPGNAGAGWGTAKGLGLTLARLCLGAYEMATFPIPYPWRYRSPYEGLGLTDYAWEMERPLLTPIEDVSR